MSDDIFTNEALAEAGYPVVPDEHAPSPSPMIDLPHFEPIHLTEQISFEYAGPRVDLPEPISAGPIDWTRLPERPISRTPRPSTIVWGFILLVIGLGLMASDMGHTIDFGLAMIWLFAAAGLALVAAAVIAGVRRKTT